MGNQFNWSHVSPFSLPQPLGEMGLKLYQSLTPQQFVAVVFSLAYPPGKGNRLWAWQALFPPGDRGIIENPLPWEVPREETSLPTSLPRLECLGHISLAA